jgi:hypothetical protein
MLKNCFILNIVLRSEASFETKVAALSAIPRGNGAAAMVNTRAIQCSDSCCCTVTCSSDYLAHIGTLSAVGSTNLLLFEGSMGP